METQVRDLEQLKQDALDRIIFHATPKEQLRQRGPWVLERGEGALLYDAEGREYLDALSGGVFAVLAGYGREEIARAMYEQAQRLAYTLHPGPGGPCRRGPGCRPLERGGSGRGGGAGRSPGDRRGGGHRAMSVIGSRQASGTPERPASRSCPRVVERRPRM